MSCKLREGNSLDFGYIIANTFQPESGSLSFHHQLICGIPPLDECHSCFGLELPNGFSPNNISILSDTHSPMSLSKRCATLLISSCCNNFSVSYCFYQLQVCSSLSTNNSVQSKFIVYCRLAASGIFDCECYCDNTSIFLASTSFNFDFSSPETGKEA